MLGLIREGEGVAALVLVALGADLNRVSKEVLQLLSGYQGKSGITMDKALIDPTFEWRDRGGQRFIDDLGAATDEVSAACGRRDQRASTSTS